MDKRLLNFQKMLRKKEVDCAIVKDKKNIFYFTKSNILSGSGFLFVPQKGKPKIVTSLLEEENIKKSFEILTYKDKKEFKNYLRELTKDFQVVGYESSIPVNTFKALKKIVKKKFVDVYEDITQLRSIKDENEIKKIVKATKVANKTIEKVKEKIKRGMKELEIWKIIKKSFIENGCEDNFCIVQVDENSAGIHKQVSNKRLKNLLLLDIGPKVNNYGTDITRTILLKNKKLQKEIYEIVLEAQKEAISKIKEGVPAKKVDSATRNFFAKYNLKKYFVHSSGHGIGLDMHETPSLSQDSREVLKKGNVITIEPGIYLKNRFGVRIEDVVLVKKKGYKILSSFIPK